MRAFFVAFAFLGGCSSSANTPATETDGGEVIDGGATPDAASDGGPGSEGGNGTMGECNAVVNGATVVAETAGTGTKPTPAGGTIADGTYFLTKHEVYAPGTPDTMTRRRTIVFKGDKWETHENDPMKGNIQGSGTYTTSGIMILFSAECFGGQIIAGGSSTRYTATDTTFMTFTPDADGDVFTSTKQ